MDLSVEAFEGHELVDSGGGRKLERFGGVLVDRPCPQAIWPARSDAPWGDAAAVFRRGEGGGGDWETRAALPESWIAPWRDLKLEIRLTGFGNVGLFPEHASHWDWMSRLIGERGSAEVLNLFAYTGGASMSCALAGALVTHVDAARSVNGWAMVNSRLTAVPDGSIRYLADDAAKLVRREARRGRRYDGIVIDPPTFGRGPKGEVWKIERDLCALVEACRALLSDEPLFAVLTSHSPGVTPAALRAVLSPLGGAIADGEMLVSGAAGPALPCGAYARWTP